MDPTLEALLTALGNAAGYAGAVLLVVHSVRKAEGRFVVGFPKAAAALFALWALVLGWAVASGYWLNTYPHAEPPDWLDASNNIAWNMQSEVWQVWLASLVFKYLAWAGSPESKD